MKTPKTLLFLLFIGFMVFAGGCSVRLGDLSTISTQNVNLDKIDLDSLPQVKGVTGKDTKFVFLFIPFGVPHLEDAVDDALEKGGGDLITDAVIHARGWWFLIGQNTLEVKGNVVKTRGGAQ
ncbi:hypothetical protein [Trichloromonas sp.]|uniref:hypothetical protein n=1 Tax=Trichloromonas sp. TaxID=3069249 RepID=UPI002A41F282|nr:hypothetical protein [Trichloromonas sp.]